MFIHTSVAAQLKMSGGKASGSKQHEDMAADTALLALLLTHREATLLFVRAARRGATDSQIADALRQGKEEWQNGSSCPAAATLARH